MSISNGPSQRLIKAVLQPGTSTPGGTRALVLFAVVSALLIRLPGGNFPPGLYHDEAWYGLDALRTLETGPRLWYEANNGREPLFLWIVAPFIGLLGASPAALRLPAALAGVVATAAIYPIGSALGGRRTGVVSSWLIALLPWSVVLGRSGLRVSLLPAALLVAVSAALYASRRPTPARAAIAGALAGLTLYTYTAARVLPVLALFACFVVWAELRSGRAQERAVERTAERHVDGSAVRRLIAIWFCGAILVSIPLLASVSAAPGGLMGRAAQVSILREGADDALLPPVQDSVMENVTAAAGLFIISGDSIPRHNIPGRPAFGVLVALFWLVGVFSAARSAVGRPGPRRAQARLILAALVLTLLPTALAEDAPHFLRASAAMPVGILLAGTGVTAVGTGLAHFGLTGRLSTYALNAIVMLAILIEGTASLRLLNSDARPITTDRSPKNPIEEDVVTGASAYYAFEGGASDLARAVNQVLGIGWSGRWVASASPSEPRNKRSPAVWLDRRLRDGWASVPYLVPIQNLTLTDPYDPVLDRPGVAFLAPDGLELDKLWSKIPTDVSIVLESGSLERGDLAAEPRTMWVRAEALPSELSQPGATGSPSEAGIRLIDVDTDVVAPRSSALDDEDIIRIKTTWRRDAEIADGLTLYIHVRGPGGQRAGNDAPLGFGVYPTRLWEIGRDVTEVRSFRVPGGLNPAYDGVFVGLYAWPSTDRLQIIDGEGAPIGRELQVWPETSTR